VRPQWLLTSRAHRLRKPHRTIRPLTPSVAGRVLNRALHARSSSPSGSLHDVNHAGIPALPGAGLAVVGLAPQRYRYQDAFRWLDLRPRGRSKLTRAPFDVCSRSLRTLFTHRESASVVSGGPPRQADPDQIHGPFGPLHPPGKMRLPNVCNRLTNMSTLWIVRPSNHRLHPLSPMMAASTPSARPKPWRRA
jgi:hypothetical protein